MPSLFCLSALLAAPASTTLVLSARPPSENAAWVSLLPLARVEQISGAADPSLIEAEDFLLKARAVLTQGQEADFAMNANNAIRKYEEAIDLFERGLVAAKSFDLVTQSLTNLGATWLSLARPERATEAFQRALTLDPHLALDPAKFNPKTVAHFRAAERALANQARGSLTIDGSPAGATVWIDGRQVGRLPLTAPDLVTGEHWIVVGLQEHRRFASRITLRRGLPNRIDVFLEPLSPALRVLRGGAVGDDDANFFSEQADGAAQVLVVAGQNIINARAWRKRDGAFSNVVSGSTKEAVVDALADFLSFAASPASAPTLAQRIEAAPKRTPALLAILPLGIGQFVEHRPLAGALFLSGELLLIAANVATAVIANNDRVPQNYYSHAANDRVLQVINLSAFAGLIALIAGEGIEGYLKRDPMP